MKDYNQNSMGENVNPKQNISQSSFSATEMPWKTMAFNILFALFCIILSKWFFDKSNAGKKKKTGINEKDDIKEKTFEEEDSNDIIDKNQNVGYTDTLNILQRQLYNSIVSMNHYYTIKPARLDPIEEVSNEGEENTLSTNSNQSILSPSLTIESDVAMNTDDKNIDFLNEGDTTLLKNKDIKVMKLTILYGSMTGTSKSVALDIQKQAFALNISGFHFHPVVEDIAEYEYQDDLDSEKLLLFVVSTYTNGTPPEGACTTFFEWMEEVQNDFRYGKLYLSKVNFAVLGLGSAYYEENFCKAANDLHDMFLELGASSLVDSGAGTIDDSIDIFEQVKEWGTNFWPSICTLYAKTYGIEESDSLTEKQSCSSGSGCSTNEKSAKYYQVPKSWEDMEKKDTIRNPLSGLVNGEEKKIKGSRKKQFLMEKKEKKKVEKTPNNDEIEKDLEDEINDLYVDYDIDDNTNDKDGEMIDLEDLGSMVKLNDKGKLGSSSSTSLTSTSNPQQPREMVTPLQRKNLIKEGYKIIGSHSAVKLCRWTKHQLRGRGGCYKHTFYGITSYQCMEMTPSLACANKCVFCWRHHKNPVGKEWRWTIDDPHMIVEEGITRHQKMIKEMKGVPGVKPERLESAFTVAHCALSLVGEPIMYPHINTLVDDLHERNISTFLVTNAQFPEEIANLSPVTQLYVSIDAATKDSLKAIDRPLFKDFWERFIGSLQQLRLKGQRTVYRLTLVKEWNMNEVEEYLQLIKIGEPDLIEIKAVTYCGTSDASSLRMTNVPWHEDVCNFAKAIADRSEGKYQFVCEHAHSCCTLLCASKFNVNGVWHTWIDYPKFSDLSRRNREDPTFTFTAEDYMAPTPSWALLGSEERGFDPEEIRYMRNKQGKKVEIPYEASESGCG